MIEFPVLRSYAVADVAKKHLHSESWVQFGMYRTQGELPTISPSHIESYTSWFLLRSMRSTPTLPVSRLARGRSVTNEISMIRSTV